MKEFYSDEPVCRNRFIRVNAHHVSRAFSFISFFTKCSEPSDIYLFVCLFA